jgi:hypothetical protein
VRRTAGRRQGDRQEQRTDARQALGYFTSSSALTMPSMTDASIFAAPGLPARAAYAASPDRAKATRYSLP